MAPQLAHTRTHTHAPGSQTPGAQEKQRRGKRRGRQWDFHSGAGSILEVLEAVSTPCPLPTPALPRAWLNGLKLALDHRAPGGRGTKSEASDHIPRGGSSCSSGQTHPAQAQRKRPGWDQLHREGPSALLDQKAQHKTKPCEPGSGHGKARERWGALSLSSRLCPKC